jgi:ribose transport system permease protein
MAKVVGSLRARPWGFGVALVVVLVVANSLARSSFATPSSWPANLADFAPFALAAMASTPQILSGGGGIDISIGPLVNFVAVIIVGVLIPQDLGGAGIAIPAVLGIGLGVGLINGTLVAVLRYQPVLATLGTFFVLSGAGLAVMGQPASGSTSWLTALGGKVGPVPGGLIPIAAAGVLWFCLGRLPYRRALFAVGGDDVAAYSAGVNIKAVRIIAYGIGGLFAAVAGIALVAATQSADPTQNTQYTLPAIAAVAIGGTSLLGGRGSLTGSLAGAAVMFMLQTLLDSLAVPNQWLQLIDGLLLILAIVLSSAVTKPQLTGEEA